MPHDLLITGFGAFPGVMVNPSARLAIAVEQDRCWVRLGLKLRSRVLEVGYGVTREILEAEAKDAPRALLMFGVAARAKTVRIETRAINRVSRTARDARRALPSDGKLEAGANTFRHARCDAIRALKAIRSGKAAAELSRNAGRYVCNAGYWSALGAMPAATSVLFVHIPMPKHFAQKWIPVLQNKMRHASKNAACKSRDAPKNAARKSLGTRPDFLTLLKGAKALALRMILSARLKS